MSIHQRPRTDEPAEAECLFCSVLELRNRRFLAQNDSFVAMEDQFPVNPGHTLLIPKRHVSKFTDLQDNELLDFGRILRETQKLIASQSLVDGFNIGVNEGIAAGQTIEHLHIHLIPRFTGDVENPRGGVRNLKTALVEY